MFRNVAYNQNPKISSQNNAVNVKSFPITADLWKYVMAVNAKVKVTRNGATYQMTSSSDLDTRLLVIRPVMPEKRKEINGSEVKEG